VFIHFVLFSVDSIMSLQLALKLSRLSLMPKQLSRLEETSRFIHSTTRMNFILTEPLSSAITKKKKRADPNIDKHRQEKRKRRIEKALKKMEKKERLPKPLIECEVPLILHKEASLRKREVKVTVDEEEERIAQAKDWARFTVKRHWNELWHLDKVILAQTRALDELRKESDPLYDAAVQIDPELIPFSLWGPVVTPPIEGYLQDGEYKDETPTYKVIYEDTEAFMKELLLRKRKRRKDKDNDE